MGPIVTDVAPYGISMAEMDALQTMADYEFSFEDATDVLCVEVSTIKSQISSIYRKTGTNRLAACYALGIREGFLR